MPEGKGFEEGEELAGTSLVSAAFVELRCPPEPCNLRRKRRIILRRIAFLECVLSKKVAGADNNPSIPWRLLSLPKLKKAPKLG